MLLLIINHSEVTQTLKKTVNIKIRREIKVWYECYTMISFSLTDRLLVTHYITEKKVTWENSIRELIIIRTEI